MLADHRRAQVHADMWRQPRVNRLGGSARWWMLGVLFIARTCMALEFQVLGAVAPLAGRDLAVDHAAMGELIGLFWLPGIFLALPAGLLGQRFGLKRLTSVGLVLMMIGSLLLARSHDYAMAAAARLIGGSGNVLVSVLVAAMVAEWFRDRELSTALAIVFDSWQFGLAASLALFPAIAEATTWREAANTAGLVCLVAAILLWLTYRSPDGPRPMPTGLPRSNVRATIRRASLLPTLAALIWTGYNVGQIIFLTYAPPLLADSDRTLSAASQTVSLTVWAAMLSMPAGGLIADRTGRMMLPVAVGAVGAGLAGIALSLGTNAVVACLVAGVFIGLPAGSILAMPARFAAAADVAWSLGWFMTVYYVLLTLTQLIAGYVRQGTDSDRATVLLGCGFLLSTALGLIPIMFVQRRARRSRVAAWSSAVDG